MGQIFIIKDHEIRNKYLHHVIIIKEYPLLFTFVEIKSRH